MSIESAKAYIERVMTDEAFKVRIEAAPGREARMSLAEEEGFDFSEEDIKGITVGSSGNDWDQCAGASAGCLAATRAVHVWCPYG